MYEPTFEMVGTQIGWKVYKIDRPSSSLSFLNGKVITKYVQNNNELKLKLGALQYEELLAQCVPKQVVSTYVTKWEQQHENSIEDQAVTIETAEMKRLHVVLFEKTREERPPKEICHDVIYFKVPWNGHGTKNRESVKAFDSMLQQVCWNDGDLTHFQQNVDIESLYKIRKWILLYYNKNTGSIPSVTYDETVDEF